MTRPGPWGNKYYRRQAGLILALFTLAALIGAPSIIAWLT